MQPQDLLKICSETGIGGVESPKIRDGVENFELSGAPEFDPFLQRDSIENPQFGPSLRGATCGGANTVLFGKNAFPLFL